MEAQVQQGRDQRTSSSTFTLPLIQVMNKLTDLFTADQPAAAAAMDEDVYDDVDSQALPPPPLHSRSTAGGLWFGSGSVWW